MSVSIARLSVEQHHDGFGISNPSPRISWSFNSTTLKNWQQNSYDITILRNGKEESYHVNSSQSILVPWPSTPLSSREIATIRVRANGENSSATEWATITIEVALLGRSDWAARLISGPLQKIDEPKPPFRLRKSFTCPQKGTSRLYATAHGIYTIQINGEPVGNQVLAPGWQSYKHRLHYQIYDIRHLLTEGENVIDVSVGEGWFAGRLGRPGVSNIWGSRLGFLAQLEVDGQPICVTDSSWEYLPSSILASEIYNGEIFDSVLHDHLQSSQASEPESRNGVEELSFPSAELVSPDVAPVERIMEIKPVKIITTPKGKKVLDFGQNLVGWLRIEIDIPGKAGDELLIRHAEVMEHGELGTRPLRTAKAQDIIKLGGKTKGYEPNFTFHGFR